DRQQRALAVGVLTCRRFLADREEPYPPAERVAAQALAAAPGASRWARDFRCGRPVQQRVFRRRAAPWVVRLSVASVVGSAGGRSDELLKGMLLSAITDVEHLRDAAAAQPAASSEKVSSVS